MKTVNVSKLIRVEKDSGFEGGIDANATTKEVVITLRVAAIPPKGGVIKLSLPWGKIYGVAKHAQPRSVKGKG